MNPFSQVDTFQRNPDGSTSSGASGPYDGFRNTNGVAGAPGIVIVTEFY